MADSKVYIGDDNLQVAYLSDNDVNAIYLGDDKVFPGETTPSPHDYSLDYFTIRSLADNNTITLNSGITGLYYSLDGTNWTENTGESITIDSGETIQLKRTGGAINAQLITTISGQFNVEGNSMSLLYGDNFSGQTELPNYNSIFSYLLGGCTDLISAEHLILPTTTLASNCYYSMFKNCTSLTTAPELPATTLGVQCYSYMFSGCTSLTTAPELPATTLSLRCYNGMFNYCSSLTTAPELPAMTLANQCYYGMFNYCSSLTTAPELPATALTSSCYAYMFRGCTSLTTASELPATVLVNNCYERMFSGCTSLSSITCLAEDITSNYCTLQWLSGVASTGTFTKAASMTSWTTGDSGIPNNWTVVDYTG